eukprot:10653992-Heterocapsa_arctica.AAC.1
MSRRRCHASDTLGLTANDKFVAEMQGKVDYRRYRWRANRRPRCSTTCSFSSFKAKLSRY